MKLNSFWMPYAMFMTALSGLFLILYVGKEGQVREVRIEKYIESDTGKSSATESRNTERAQSDTDTQERKKLLQGFSDKIQNALEVEFDTLEIENLIGLEQKKNSVLLRITGQSLFEMGSVEIAQDVFPLVKRIGVSLSKAQAHIWLEGHADINESALAKKRYGVQDSRQALFLLSAARAAYIADYWLKERLFKEGQLQVTGVGAQKMLSNQSTNQGQEWVSSRNRRVEFLILENSGY